MRSMVTSPREVHWRGVAAFALDNVLPLLGLVALVAGAFHLPGAWGSVGGFVVLGLGLLKVHDALADDIATLKAQAAADRIDRERAAVTQKRIKAVA